MVHEFQLRVQPYEAANEQSLARYIAREKGMDERTINAVRVLRRSIDARQRTIYINLTVRVFVNEMPPADEFTPREYPNVEGKRPVIVVGAGPAGLFAALKLIENGLRPIVVERGKDVHSRRADIAKISREHLVDPESNYSFGEGGAGAFSDGKLSLYNEEDSDNYCSGHRCRFGICPGKEMGGCEPVHSLHEGTTGL